MQLEDQLANMAVQEVAKYYGVPRESAIGLGVVGGLIARAIWTRKSDPDSFPITLSLAVLALIATMYYSFS